MSKIAALLNTASAVGDVAALAGEWFIVAEARDRIPLPWLCLFGEADLRPCTLSFLTPRTVDGQPRQLLAKFPILNPCIAVKEARANLAKARPVFEQLANDAATGARHWKEAMASLERLPLGWLTIDPTRVLATGDRRAAATTYARAFSTGSEANVARRHLARLDPDASASDNFEGLDGGFHLPDEFIRRQRTIEETRRSQALLARLESCNLAQTAGGFEPLPLDLDSLEPPEAFWNDEAFLARGRARAVVRYGDYTFMGERKYYATQLENVGERPIRVRMFAGFNKAAAGYRMANYTGAWFGAKEFVDWYKPGADGWIAPGQVAADPTNWGGDEEGFWAYWCEDDAQQRFMAFAWRRPSIAGGRVRTDDDGRTLMPTAETWQPCPESILAVIESYVANVKQMAREQSKREIDCDAEGVQWLDDLIERQHQASDRGNFGHLIPVFGAFFGEALRRRLGARWERYDEILCVRQGPANSMNVQFPFFKVKKQLLGGRAAGDSVVGMFHAAVAMQPKPLAVRQQRFKELFEQRPDCLFYVAEGAGQWARVKEIDGPWLVVESAKTQGLRVVPRVSVRLDTVKDLKVTDGAGMPVDLGRDEAAPPPPPAPAQPPARPLALPALVRDASANPEFEAAIARLRAGFGERRKSLQARTVEAVRAAMPAWMKTRPDDALREVLENQDLLLTEGRISWGAIVQANKLLFSPGTSDCPAQLLHSHDTHFDARPHQLGHVAERIYELKSTKPTDPRLQLVAERVTNEIDRAMNWRLPEDLTARDVRASIVMVFRKHLPNGVLKQRLVPVLTHPSTEAILIVPFEFWPPEMIGLWKAGRL
jgi:hypothetical protein